MYALISINAYGVRFYENIDTREKICCTGHLWWKDTEPSPSMYMMQIPTPESYRFLDN